MASHKLKAKNHKESPLKDAIVWQQIELAYAKQRLAHALLLVGPMRSCLVEFSKKIAALIVCSQEKPPCNQCKACYLLATAHHPDLHYVQPENAGGVIKIEQIRDLQEQAFTSTQLGGRRVIIINPAEKMNGAAANALLKLLEEPPSHVSFILITEQIASLAPTVLSRCQLWRFPAPILNEDYLAYAAADSSKSGRMKIVAEMNQVIQNLLDLANKEVSLCTIAQAWSTYELSDLLWFLYLIHAQLIASQLRGSSLPEQTARLLSLTKRFKLPFFFNQLDKINEIIKKLVNNIHVNAVLALEDFLLGYVKVA